MGGLKVTYRGNRKLVIVEDDKVHVLRTGVKVNLMHPEKVIDKRGNLIFEKDLIKPQPEEIEIKLSKLEKAVQLFGVSIMEAIPQIKEKITAALDGLEEEPAE